jgi:hypothetical protein
MRNTHPSDDIKEEILYFINQLLNYGVHTNLSRGIQIEATWNKENLKIASTIDQLIQLLPPEAKISRTIPQQKHHLAYILNKILKEPLKILQDDRLTADGKLQGIKAGNFTLKLWHPPTQEDYILLNNSALERHWNKTYKITPKNIAPHRNLPQRQHTQYIGHQQERQTLCNILTSGRQQIIEIVGMAGVGKTTLALEIAYQSLTDHTLGNFSNIIFNSAQTQQLKSYRVSSIPSHIPKRNLQDLLQNIFNTLDRPHELPLDLEAQILHTHKILGQHPTLLIIDNIENLTAQTDIIDFISYLPPTVKIIITSRIRLGIGQVIDLQTLNAEESLALIKHQAQTHSLPIDSSQRSAIHQRTGGLPIAITYLVSLIAVAGDKILEEIEQLPLANTDLALYCFSKIIQELQSRPDQTAYQILLTLSLVPDGATISAITQINQLTNSLTHSGLQQLYQISLAFPHTPEKYYLHSLTQEYTQQQLQPDQAAQLRQRWQTWYLELIAPYGALDWQDWQDYSPLVAEWKNLRMAMDWSIEQQKYLDVLQFWQCLKGVTLLSGYWLERQRWLQWLQEMAITQQDLPTIAELKYHHSLTLGYLNEADEQGQAIAIALEAWQMHQHLPLIPEYDLAMYIASLYIRKLPQPDTQAANLESATAWIDRGIQILTALPINHPRYYRCYFQIHYYQGEIQFITNQLASAREQYQTANQLAKKAHCQRFIHFSSVRIAMIQIKEGQQTEMAEAENRLQKALKFTTQYHDCRAQAFCYKNLADVNKAQGKFSKAREFAEFAKTKFTDLQMHREAAMVDRFLQDLETEPRHRKQSKPSAKY